MEPGSVKKLTLKTTNIWSTSTLYKTLSSETHHRSHAKVNQHTSSAASHVDVNSAPPARCSCPGVEAFCLSSASSEEINHAVRTYSLILLVKLQLLDELLLISPQHFLLILLINDIWNEGEGVEER